MRGSALGNWEEMQEGLRNPYQRNIFDRREEAGRAHRVREQDYMAARCRFCFSNHRSEADKCYIMCHYCHGIHFKKDIKKEGPILNTTICPLLQTASLQAQKEKSFPCEDCGGHGSFEKVIVTSFCEPLSNFKTVFLEYERMKE